MSYMNQAAFASPLAITDLSFDEIDFVGGASTWGENVIKYGGVGGAIGAFVGPEGAAAGIIAGAIIGTAVTIFD